MKQNKKAFTLIEVILAIAIFAAVALPLLTVYVQSFKVDTAARGVLNANYISQQYIEKLDTQLYEEALDDLPDKQAQGDYYLSATITPHGSGGGAFVHLIVLPSGKMLAVMPDGEKYKYSSVPSSIRLSVSGDQYTLDCSGSGSHSGHMYRSGGGNGNGGNGGGGHGGGGGGNTSGCTVIINVMKLPSNISPNITLSGCKGLVYCTSDNADNMNISGEYDKYPDMFTGDTSLIHVWTSVYETADAAEPVSQSEAYINIRNWYEE